MQQAINQALKTWYPTDHPLHNEPHHPLGKLLGEWGEVLEDHLKKQYKPGYEPDTEKELGDVWYYIRILCHQFYRWPIMDRKISFPEIDLVLTYSSADTDIIISAMIHSASKQFLIKKNSSWQAYHPMDSFIDTQYSGLVEIAKRNDLTIDDLTRSNWEKLKPGSERGEQWTKAWK